MEQLDSFDTRAAAYSDDRVALFNDAVNRFPEARSAELEHLLHRLDLAPGITVLDATAGGGYLAEGIWNRLGGDCTVICLENSKSFLKSISSKFDRRLSSLKRLEVADSQVDRVASLAGIHHQQDKLAFFREAFRILRPGGRIAIGDVLDGTGPAKFLNIAVDRYTEPGHAGIFPAQGELTELLRESGFAVITEEHEAFTWILPDYSSLVWFCRALFRMTRASEQQVREEINRYLNPAESDAGATMDWSMTYATGMKPLAG